MRETDIQKEKQKKKVRKVKEKQRSHQIDKKQSQSSHFLLVPTVKAPFMDLDHLVSAKSLIVDVQLSIQGRNTK